LNPILRRTTTPTNLIGQASNSVLSFGIVNGQLSAASTSNPTTGEAPIAVVAVP